MPTIFDLVWYGDTTLQLKYYEEVVCAPFGRWVGEYKFYGAKLSVFHCGAKLSVFTWRCQIVRFYMTVPNCPRCQIVRFTWRCQIVRVPNCPFLHCGAKLSVFHCGAKLSAVPNCPQCQIVLESALLTRLASSKPLQAKACVVKFVTVFLGIDFRRTCNPLTNAQANA